MIQIQRSVIHHVRWLGALVLLAGTASLAVADESGQSGFYTKEQAKRGQVAFNKYCAVCHTVDSTTPIAEQIKTGRGIRVGTDPNHALMNLGGKYLFSAFDGHPNYPSVYYLFNRIREGMPAFGADTVGLDMKIDIVAYILQSNGLPPGSKELTTDVPALKKMRIPGNQPKQDEAGFEPIFNGKDFTGWAFMLGPNCRTAPEGCGRVTPSGIYRVEDGKVICTGKIQGYMYTVKKYLNFTLRFDYRFQPPKDWTEEDGVVFYGNSGYFLFINDHRVWPKGIQIEGYYRRPLIPFLMDTKAKFTEEPGAMQKSIRPLGEWNSVEIKSKDGKIYSSQNGILLNTITEHEFKEPGSIGFESEGSELHWRNIRIKAE
jgi:mono/diheme cytochrome c family protein